MDLKASHIVSFFMVIFSVIGIIVASRSKCIDDPFHEMPLLPFTPLLMFLSGFQLILAISTAIGGPISAEIGPLLLTIDAATATLIGVSLLHGDALCDDFRVYRMLVAFFIYCCIRVATLTVTIGLSLFRFKMIIEKYGEKV
jgi:hypothetical protein